MTDGHVEVKAAAESYWAGTASLTRPKEGDIF